MSNKTIKWRAKHISVDCLGRSSIIKVTSNFNTESEAEEYARRNYTMYRNRVEELYIVLEEYATNLGYKVIKHE